MSRDLASDPLRIGILGCGSFVQRRILSALPEAPFVRVVNIQKRDPDEARVVAKRFSIPHSTDSRDELLADPQVEAVMIASINPMHEADAMACAAAGKPCLCDKPLALESGAVQRMMAAFREAGLKLLVGHSCRFKPAVRKALETVRSGKLGEVRSMRGFFSFIPPAYNWRYDWALGGGVLRDLGPHIIDFFRYVSGKEVRAVAAVADEAFSPDEDRADTALKAILRMDDDCMAELAVSYREYSRNGFEVCGAEGILEGWQTLRQSSAPGESLGLITEKGFQEITLPKANIYAEELQHLATVVVEDAPPTIDASHGLAAQFIIDALYRSAQEKREVEVPMGD